MSDEPDHATDDRRSLGESDGPMEDVLEESFTLDSLLIFGALHTGDAPFGYGDWTRFLALTVVGNMAWAWAWSRS